MVGLQEETERTVEKRTQRDIYHVNASEQPFQDV